jgi:hypothetical protein
VDAGKTTGQCFGGAVGAGALAGAKETSDKGDGSEMLAVAERAWRSESAGAGWFFGLILGK